MLTSFDDYPVHQTAEPVAHARPATQPYDRYFFNGYSRAGDSSSPPRSASIEPARHDGSFSRPRRRQHRPFGASP
jgi:hypothetical protein